MPRPPGGALSRGRSCSDTRLGRNPASVLPAPVGATSRVDRPAFALASNSTWWARGVQPRVANHAENGAGSKADEGFFLRARAVTPRSGTSATGYGECNVPIACGGVVVHPGDLIIGDSEGLVVVPRIWIDALADSLGTTGHTAYDPGAIRDKLAAIPPGSKPQWNDKLQKSLIDRKATVIEDYYPDGGEA